MDVMREDNELEFMQDIDYTYKPVFEDPDQLRQAKPKKNPIVLPY